MNKDIVSTKEEDKPLIFISEETINLKRDNDKLKQENERLNKENEKLKNGLNKLLQLNNYMVNFSSKKVIGKLIVKQRDLIYELLEGRPRGIMFGSKGVDKE